MTDAPLCMAYVFARHAVRNKSLWRTLTPRITLYTDHHKLRTVRELILSAGGSFLETRLLTDFNPHKNRWETHLPPARELIADPREAVKKAQAMLAQIEAAGLEPGAHNTAVSESFFERRSL